MEMAQQTRPYRILIVDDAPAVREAIRWLLEDEPDLTVVGEASNGLEALQRTAGLLPDVVILDVEMPLMDGFTVARSLKAAIDPPLVLFLSVHGDATARARGLAAGGDGFIEKGADWPTLIEQLRRLLGD